MNINQIIDKIKTVHEYVKNELILENIQKKTIEFLSDKYYIQVSNNQRITNQHFLILNFIMENIHDQMSAKEKLTLTKSIIEFDINRTESEDLIQKNENAKDNKIYQNDEQKFLIPELIYFISESFRPIFLPYENEIKMDAFKTKNPNSIVFLKKKMLKSWENNINLVPFQTFDFLKSDKQNIRTLFDFVFKNPHIYHITHFYNKHLPAPFDQNLIQNFDDNDFQEYYNFLVRFKSNKKIYNLNTTFSNIKSHNAAGDSQHGLNNFQIWLKELLKIADPLPDFSLPFNEEDTNISSFIHDYLVSRGNLSDYENRCDYFREMENYCSSSTYRMDEILIQHLDEIQYDHSEYDKEIQKLSDELQQFQEYSKILYTVYEKSSLLFKYHYSETIMNQILLKKKPLPKSNGIFTNWFKINESSNDKTEADKDIRYDQLVQKIKNPDLIREEYLYITKNDESNTFSSPISSNIDITYDYNTMLAFHLLKDITFFEFLKNRPSVRILDSEYKYHFKSKNGKNKFNEKTKQKNKGKANKRKQFKQNKNDDNDNNNKPNKTQQNKKGNNKANPVQENNKVSDLIQKLILAFEANTNPLQKLIDIKKALNDIDNYEHKNIQDQKLFSFQNIPFHIFNEVLIPKFVSAIIFIFDYYFLVFNRNPALQTLFLQIYNFAMMEGYLKNELHFNLTSIEENLYQYLRMARKRINIIMFGTECRNTLVEKILKNSISTQSESENEVYLLSDFIKNVDEVTCYIFENSTYYECSIKLYKETNDIPNFKNYDMNSIHKFIYVPQELNIHPDVDRFVDTVKDIKKTNIIVESAKSEHFMDLKDKAIIYKLETFDIRNLVK